MASFRSDERYSVGPLSVDSFLFGRQLFVRAPPWARSPTNETQDDVVRDVYFCRHLVCSLLLPTLQPLDATCCSKRTTSHNTSRRPVTHPTRAQPEVEAEDWYGGREERAIVTMVHVCGLSQHTGCLPKGVHSRKFLNGLK
jgi:hypothetical protein